MKESQNKLEDLPMLKPSTACFYIHHIAHFSNLGIVTLLLPTHAWVSAGTIRQIQIIFAIANIGPIPITYLIINVSLLVVN